MIRKSQISNPKSQIKKPKIILVILALLMTYFLFVSLRSSLFLNRKDRLNIIIYGEETAFYSYGFKDGVNYFISYPADVKILVPGGFGYYRLGALGKLVELEKKSDIIKKAFSTTTGSFIDLYFYPKKNSISFGRGKKVVFFPKLTTLLTSKTNASIIDRLFILILFTTKQKNNFRQITNLPVKMENSDIYFDEKKFYDEQLGYFYQESMRQEKANVQIIYSNSVKNANLISKIIEGQGIRVADISYKKDLKTCYIVEDTNQNLKTTNMLANFFNCFQKKGKTSPYDIILELGVKEKEWAL